ncbi:MAG: PqqD family protein [Myxococcales bacterium]
MTRPTISLDSVVQATPRQVSTELGEETVILGVERGQYFGLSEVGTRLWALVQEPTSVDALCCGLFAEYEVSRPTLESDVLELLAALHDQGLIDVLPRPQPQPVP